MASWLKDKPAKKRLWDLPDKTFKRMLLPDLRAARAAWLRETTDPAERRRRRESDFLAPVDHDGHVIDMHSFRHGYITRIVASGVPVPLAQRLARHASPKLTLTMYSHFGLADDRAAVERVFSENSEPRMATDEHIALRMTGTDGSGHAPDSPVRAPNAHHAERPTPHNGASQRTPVDPRTARVHLAVNPPKPNENAPARTMVREGALNTGGRSRTCNLLIRSQVLYPIELRPQAWEKTTGANGGRQAGGLIRAVDGQQ